MCRPLLDEQPPHAVEQLAEVVLDRPDVLNSLDESMVAEFHTVLDGTRPPRYSDLRIGLWYALTR